MVCLALMKHSIEIGKIPTWDAANILSRDLALKLMYGKYNYKEKRAYTRVTRFILAENNLYEKFDEVMTTTIFEIEVVKQYLLERWSRVEIVCTNNFSKNILQLEKKDRVMFIAYK